MAGDLIRYGGVGVMLHIVDVSGYETRFNETERDGLRRRNWSRDSSWGGEIGLKVLFSMNLLVQSRDWVG